MKIIVRIGLLVLPLWISACGGSDRAIGGSAGGRGALGSGGANPGSDGVGGAAGAAGAAGTGGAGGGGVGGTRYGSGGAANGSGGATGVGGTGGGASGNGGVGLGGTRGGIGGATATGGSVGLGGASGGGSSGGGSSGGGSSGGGGGGALTSGGGRGGSGGVGGGNGSGAGGQSRSGVDGSKLLIDLTPEQKGQVCDWAASLFGGYGQSHTCADGTTAMSRSSRDACVADAIPPNCAATVAEEEACGVTVRDLCASALSTPECQPILPCTTGGPALLLQRSANVSGSTPRPAMSKASSASVPGFVVTK